jgi:hypothetical protein
LNAGLLGPSFGLTDVLPMRRRDAGSAGDREDSGMAQPEWTESDVEGIIVNPFYAVNIDATLAVEHEPHVSKSDWVKSNLRAMEEIGAERWLYRLLDVLETGGPHSPEAGNAGDDAPYGFRSGQSRQQRRLKERRLAKRSNNQS